MCLDAGVTTFQAASTIRSYFENSLRECVCRSAKLPPHFACSSCCVCNVCEAEADGWQFIPRLREMWLVCVEGEGNGVKQGVRGLDSVCVCDCHCHAVGDQ